MSEILKSVSRKHLPFVQIRGSGTHNMGSSQRPNNFTRLQSESQVALVYEMSSSRPGTSDSYQQDAPKQTNTDINDVKPTNDTITPDAQRDPSKAEKEDAKEVQWVSGTKLWILMAPICLTFFLVMLDISIIATVSNPGISVGCVQ